MAARGATIGIFLLLTGAALYAAKTLVAPIVSAIVISAMLGPLSAWSSRRRVPPVIFALACAGTILLTFYIIAIMVGGAAVNLTDKTSEIAAAFKAKAQFLEQPIALLRDLQDGVASALGSTSPPLRFDFSASSVIGPVVEFLTPALGEIILFFATLFFLLASRDTQRRFLVLLFEGQEARLRALRILNDIEQNVTRYIGVVSAVNLMLGVLTAGVAYALALPNPALAGLMSFLLNYIPYIGPTITAALLLLAGIIALPSLLDACIAPAIFAAMATVEGHFVTPSIVGRQLTLSPLATFLSLAFWTWLWGPLGAFLASPFLIAMAVIREHFSRDDDVKLPG